MKLTTLINATGAVFAIALQLGSPAQAKDKIPGVAEQPTSYFYTGKPYDKDLGGYQI